MINPGSFNVYIAASEAYAKFLDTYLNAPKQ